jgi:hypothetical protein
MVSSGRIPSLAIAAPLELRLESESDVKFLGVGNVIANLGTDAGSENCLDIVQFELGVESLLVGLLA